MTAQIINFFDYGPKYRNEERPRSVPRLHDVGGKPAFTYNGVTTILGCSDFSDDVQLPSDTEPPNEPA